MGSTPLPFRAAALRRQSHPAATAGIVAISAAGNNQPLTKEGFATDTTSTTCTAVATEEQSAAAAAISIKPGAARALAPIAPMVATLEMKPPKKPATGSPLSGPRARNAT